MSPETRILFSFSFGSHGQCFLLAVGFGLLPTTTANCAVIVATHTRDIKGFALGEALG